MFLAICFLRRCFFPVSFLIAERFADSKQQTKGKGRESSLLVTHILSPLLPIKVSLAFALAAARRRREGEGGA